MHIEHSIAAVIALAVGVSAAALHPGRAQAQASLDAPAALESPYRIVDACGGRFVELAPQSVPEQLTWGEFGAPFDSAFGVTAYAHGAEGDARRDNPDGLYQCTELVHRYLREALGVPTRIGLGLGHGVDVAQRVAERFGAAAYTGGRITGSTPVSLRYFPSGESTCAPLVGAVVSIAMPSEDGGRGYGHVAVIRALERESDDVIIATLFEQHGGSSLTPGETVGAGRVRFMRFGEAWAGVFLSQGGGTFPVEGWTNIAAVDDGLAPASGAP
ncbi:MAG: hypothetical protein NW200_00840 [Hyphomonadaceae bacterium]|nr:hypothetical protein [Hyphomonadaceae bacterium]